MFHNQFEPEFWKTRQLYLQTKATKTLKATTPKASAPRPPPEEEPIDKKKLLDAIEKEFNQLMAELIADLPNWFSKS
jgi:hypothetical protein